MKFLFTTAGIIFWFGCLAHNPSETYSKIYLNESKLQFEIEFPWTISEAVKLHYPQGKDKFINEDFLSMLEKYVAANLILKQKGQPLQITGFREISSDHSHSANLLLSYSAKNLNDLEITNTLMFNLNGKQKNYHILFQKNEPSTTFYTCPTVKTYSNRVETRIKSDPSFSLMAINLSCWLIIGIIVYWVFDQKKLDQKSQISNVSQV